MTKFYLYHTTDYTYSDPVIESSNKILLYPYNDLNQQLVNHSISVSGNPNIFTYIDDYNNRVGFFTIAPPIKSLVISSEAEIISKKIIFPEDKLHADEQWSLLKKYQKSIDFLPFLINEKINADNEITKLLSRNINTNYSPLENAKILCDYIHKNFIYQKGITNVFTTIDEIWKIKSWVCQDFTNVLIFLCRKAKIPARYVSGYVFADKTLRGAGATHAWVEIFIPNYGWLGLDPTNNCIANDFHIRLAVGRNYEDCAPVKGVYKGNQTQLMNVNVHLGTKRKTKNFELSNKQSLDYTNFENNKQNSFRKNLEMIQQQQQQ